jgi:tetratricopeptide (TPR) repeat protein
MYIKLILALCFFSFSWLCVDCLAQTYGYKDEAGNWHFSNAPTDPRFFKPEPKASPGSDDHRQAIEDYNRAIEVNPKDTVAYVERGIAYAKLGDHRQAIRDYDKAIGLNPNLAEAYMGRGIAYIFLGDYRQGIPDCNKAIELNPNDGRAYLARGFGYVRLGDIPQGFENLRIAARLGLKEAQDLCRSQGINW